MSYQGYTLEESYPSAEMQSVYLAAPDDWAKKRRFSLFSQIMVKAKNLSFGVNSDPIQV